MSPSAAWLSGSGKSRNSSQETRPSSSSSSQCVGDWCLVLRVYLLRGGARWSSASSAAHSRSFCSFFSPRARLENNTHDAAAAAAAEHKCFQPPQLGVTWLRGWTSVNCYPCAQKNKKNQQERLRRERCSQAPGNCKKNVIKIKKDIPTRPFFLNTIFLFTK